MMNYLRGMTDILSGFGLITQAGIRRFVIIPLLINLTLFSLALKLLADQMDIWIDSLLPDWLGWLEFLIWPLFFIMVSLAIFYSFTIIANLIAAPFNSLLSARIEAELTGRRPEDITDEKFWKIAVRTFASEIGKLLYFIKWLIPVVIITFIPVINVISPFLWFLYAAWSFSLEYTDYPLANRGMLFKDIREHNRVHRMRSLGLGTGIFFMTSIPILNFFAMPVAVAGATRLTVVQGENNG